MILAFLGLVAVPRRVVAVPPKRRIRTLFLEGA